MKKLIIVGILATGLAAHGAVFQSLSFLNDTVASAQVTNPACATCYSQGFGGITITNAAAAPFGGYTNIKSWSYSGVFPGTNAMGLTWTNNIGQWVIVTNAVVTNVTAATGITNLALKWVGPSDSTDLTKDIPLPPMETGGINYGMYPGFATNSAFPGSASVALAEAAMFGNCTLSVRAYGAQNAGEIANKVNLIFVGVPSGQNGLDEPSSLTQTAIPAFQWGITLPAVASAPGTTVTVTNFPIWRFAGCGAIRLRSITSTATTNNMAVTIQDLRFNGYYPSIH